MLWNELQAAVEWQSTGLFDRWREAVRWFLLKRRIRRLFDGFPRHPERKDLQRLIPLLQRSYYQVRQEELTAEIDRIEKQLATSDAPAMVARLSDDSMRYLRSRLAARYGKGHKRPIFQHITPELLKEYPVVLSTTFSSRSNFRAETLFDYVIMDEASQVSSETGALALMCARNAVIVGDSMQLPNVISDADRLRMQAIAAKHAIDPRYDCAALSFLESVCRVFPEAPQTLLREHYRCHPKIINFCNQRFYGGRLLIMTEDRGEPDVITAWRTARGITRGEHSIPARSRQSGARCCRHSPASRPKSALSPPTTSRSMRSTASWAEVLTWPRSTSSRDGKRRPSSCRPSTIRLSPSRMISIC